MCKPIFVQVSVAAPLSVFTHTAPMTRLLQGSYSLLSSCSKSQVNAVSIRVHLLLGLLHRLASAAEERREGRVLPADWLLEAREEPGGDRETPLTCSSVNKHGAGITQDLHLCSSEYSPSLPSH